MGAVLGGGRGANGNFLQLPAPKTIDLIDSYTWFFALFNQINRRSIKPIETTTPSNPPEQRP
jgi:hypothetical protein